MDGAARFSQRDSLATILITVINIIAGLLIGTLQQGVELGEAARTYTVLTVGDGLVTLIPSLLVSVAGGITLTRANSAGMLGSEIRQQLFAMAGDALSFRKPGLAGNVPDPRYSQDGISCRRRKLVLDGEKSCRPSAAGSQDGEAGSAEKKKSGDARSANAEEIAGLLRLEELTLEIGFQLIPLVDEKQGGQLLGRVRTLRRQLSAELGFLIPPVHISDNLRLKPREYVFSLRGIEIGRWQTEGAQLLAVSGSPAVGRSPAGRRASRPSEFPQSGSLRALRTRPSPPVTRWWTRSRWSRRIWAS